MVKSGQISKVFKAEMSSLSSGSSNIAVTKSDQVSDAKQGSNPKEEHERVDAEAEPEQTSSSETLPEKKKYLQVRIKNIKDQDQLFFTVGVLFILFTEYILLCQVSTPKNRRF